MVRYYEDTGVHHASIEKVWKMILAHTDQNVGHIHPGFVKQRTREESPGVYRVEADVRGPDGKIGRMTFRGRASPPHSQTIEFLEGPFRGWYTGVYVSEGPNRTRIIAVGDITIPGLEDEASTLKAVDDFMNMGFEQDAEYIAKM